MHQISYIYDMYITKQVDMFVSYLRVELYTVKQLFIRVEGTILHLNKDPRRHIPVLDYVQM